MKTICIIPARGNSVRIPRKNIKPFHGKPIMLYSIETAQRSMLFDEIIVSTDDAEISKVARRAGATVFWRRGMDDGTKGTQEVAADVLREKPAGMACVLYATAPLIQSEDLLVGWQAMAGLQAFNSICYAMSVNIESEDIGGFYWGFGHSFATGLPLGSRPSWRHTTPLFVPDERCCDINTPEDWARAESMFEALRRAP
jgi:pseudaminic acid cytidylyltransferase